MIVKINNNQHLPQLKKKKIQYFFIHHNIFNLHFLNFKFKLSFIITF